MAAPNLLKRFVKELERGGKKTVVLGLLLLGGMYFWIPMIGHALFPKRKSDAAPRVAQTSTPAMPPNDGDDDAPAIAVTSVEWKSLYQRLQTAQSIVPVPLADLVRDPFDQMWIREKAAPQITAKSDAPQETNPTSSMAVSAILVGANGGSAVINNVVYRQGDFVPRDGSMRYVLKAILPDRVVLEREGNSFEIKLAGRDRETIEK